MAHKIISTTIDQFSVDMYTHGLCFFGEYKVMNDDKGSEIVSVDFNGIEIRSAIAAVSVIGLAEPMTKKNVISAMTVEFGNIGKKEKDLHLHNLLNLMKHKALTAIETLEKQNEENSKEDE